MSTKQDAPNARPDGWPRWLWFLVQCFVKRENRTELMYPDQRAKTARELANLLYSARADAKEWRERAMSAERVPYEIGQAMKEGCRRHDKAHGTMISWNI